MDRATPEITHGTADRLVKKLVEAEQAQARAESVGETPQRRFRAAEEEAADAANFATSIEDIRDRHVDWVAEAWRKAHDAKLSKKGFEMINVCLADGA